MLPMLLCMLLCVASQGQPPRQPAKKLDMPLEDALTFVSVRTGVRFIYSKDLVRSTRLLIDTAGIMKMPVEQLLQRILPALGLSYKQVGDKYYSIVPATIPKAALSPVQPALPPAQSAQSSVITGTVTERKTGKPIPMVSVTLSPVAGTTVTDENGEYVFRNVPSLTVTISVEAINMTAGSRQVSIDHPGLYTQSFQLEENVLSLKEVQVVAREEENGGAASVISRSAIAHLQAASLADVMQLLPGELASNPDLSKVNKFTIRQVDPDNMGSLGTAVLINGIPLSNNANLQAPNTARGGANASFANTIGAGTDLRSITADNIESVEVIRGVPSVEYGDLTSGAILVKTRAGQTPLEIRARVNPRLNQAWIGKGLLLKNNGGALNLDFDYSRAYGDQRYEAGGYTRVTANALYSRQFFRKKKLNTTTGFTYSTNLDETKQDPDDQAQKLALRAQEHNFRWNTTGKWNLQSALSRQLNYTLSVNYSIQKGFQQQQTGGVTAPLITARKDTTMVAQYLPTEYLSRLWIDGRPLNLFAKLTDLLYVSTGPFKHRILLGAEWKMDANYGAGKTFDVNRPPNPSADGNATRPRKYSDIPALTQLTFYAEDNITAKVLDRPFSLQAGLRMDKVPSLGQVWSPRFNVSYRIAPSLTLRGGYGITAKTPTLLYLYPEPAYFDYINLNYYADNAAERLLIGTTRVFDTRSSRLRFAADHKKEISIDWKPDGRHRLTVTAFHERVRNGYNFSYTLNSVRVVSIDTFSIVSRPAGQPPVVRPSGTENRFATFFQPTNNQENINKGIEFDFDLGHSDLLRTSFILNGAWISSTTRNTYYTIQKNPAQDASQPDPDKVAIYPAGKGTGDQQLSSTLRMVHHIPALRMVATVSVQTLWISKNNYIGYDSLPLGYISRSDGGITWLDQQERQAVTRANRELFTNVSPEYYVTESWKPLWLFNLRMTKELGRHVVFAFYANNVFSSNPVQESNRWKGNYTRRNPDIFFGSELNIKF